MSIKTRLASFLGLEHRAGYTNDAIDALLGQAQTTGGQPSATAAVATAVQAISAPFGTAILRGSPTTLSGAFLIDLVRRLMLAGNAVYAIDIDRGGILLRPASDFKVSGNPLRLSYELEMANPGGEPTIHRASADGVVHFLVNPTENTPWAGRAPWKCAAISTEALALIERGLHMDSSIPTGMLLPVPDGISEKARNGVRNALEKGRGKITPVETTSGGFGQGSLARPAGDYDQKRFGTVVLEPNLKMRDSTSLAVLRSYGVSPKVLDGDGNAMREARRALFLDTILPLAALVSQELSEKLDATISLDFGPSQYRDYQRLSRSLKTFIDAGLSLGQAAALLGINLIEGTPPLVRNGRQAGDITELMNRVDSQDDDRLATPIDTPSRYAHRYARDWPDGLSTYGTAR